MTLTTIRTYLVAQDAHLDKSFLEQHGVQALVTGDPNCRPEVPQITLRVPADSVEQALRILKDHER